jgi:hypothetical protein
VGLRPPYSGAKVAYLTVGDVRRKCSLDEGQIPNFRGVRVDVSTRYHRVEGNRRASRDGRVSDLPPEIHTVTIRDLFRRCTPCERGRPPGLLWIHMCGQFWPGAWGVRDRRPHPPGRHPTPKVFLCARRERRGRTSASLPLSLELPPPRAMSVMSSVKGVVACMCTCTHWSAGRDAHAAVTCRPLIHMVPSANACPMDADDTAHTPINEERRVSSTRGGFISGFWVEAVCDFAPAEALPVPDSDTHMAYIVNVSPASAGWAWLEFGDLHNCRGHRGQRTVVLGAARARVEEVLRRRRLAEIPPQPHGDAPDV